MYINRQQLGCTHQTKLKLNVNVSILDLSPPFDSLYLTYTEEDSKRLRLLQLRLAIALEIYNLCMWKFNLSILLVYF